MLYFNRFFFENKQVYGVKFALYFCTFKQNDLYFCTFKQNDFKNF